MNTDKKFVKHPVAQFISDIINKLRQNPNVYPIKYYKKIHRYKRFN